MTTERPQPVTPRSPRSYDFLWEDDLFLDPKDRPEGFADMFEDRDEPPPLTEAMLNAAAGLRSQGPHD